MLPCHVSVVPWLINLCRSEVVHIKSVISDQFTGLSSFHLQGLTSI